jgi:hypothetical protein
MPRYTPTIFNPCSKLDFFTPSVTIQLTFTSDMKRLRASGCFGTHPLLSTILRSPAVAIAGLILLFSSFSSSAFQFEDLDPYFSFTYGDASPGLDVPAQQQFSPNAIKLFGDVGPIAGSNWAFGFVLYFHGLLDGSINPGDNYTADLTFDLSLTGGSASWDFFSEIYTGDYTRIQTDPAAVPQSGHVGPVHLESPAFTSPSDGAFIDGYLHLDWTGYNPGDTLTLSIPQNSIDITSVPEPGAIALIFAAGTVWASKRKKPRNSSHPR